MIDLHIHTTFSDGSNTPHEILELANKLQLKQIAITDHNNIAGALDALKYIHNYSFDFIIGTELSCEYNGKEVHLLGYFNKSNDDFNAIKEFINNSEKSKKTAQLEMIKKLNQKGFFITYDEVISEFVNTTINRVHLSKILMKKGYVSSINEAFKLYLGEDKDCYVQRKNPSLKQGVEAIHKCHGKAVLAHPFQYVKEDMEEFLKDALILIDGIEAIHSDHNDLQRKELIRIADKYNKIITGGSDYHGINKPHIQLSQANVPNQYYLHI